MIRYFALSDSDKEVKMYSNLDDCVNDNPNKDYYQVNNKIVTRILVNQK